MRVLILPLLLLIVAGCSPKSEPVPEGVSPVAQDAKPGLIDETGIPTYPGAKLVEKNTAAPAKNGSRRMTAILSTTDPYNKVVAFYQDRVKMASISPNPRMTQFVGLSSNGNPAQMFINDVGGKTTVTVYVVVK
ncbi:MAG: hypothetical protein QOJ65_429 [Fimbriimonadaceae bacterium]|jgi:hypothetical protein|nr:hypothetical protein [Fimbriimonadaceae bacterium]